MKPQCLFGLPGGVWSAGLAAQAAQVPRVVAAVVYEPSDVSGRRFPPGASSKGFGDTTQ